MKIAFIVSICLIFVGCNTTPDGSGITEMPVSQIRQERIELDFNVTEAQIIDQLSKTYPNLTPKQISVWEETGELEMRIINGEKKYFRNAVSNLYRLNSEARQKRDNIYGLPSSGLNEFRVHQAEHVLSEIDNKNQPQERNWHIQFTITVQPGVVPNGEIVKCWMPYPKPHQSRLTNIRLISVNNENILISDSNSLHRSLYMEKQASDEHQTQFRYELSFSTQAEWVDPLDLTSLPYDHSSETFMNNTQEQFPHIVFTEEVRQLADSLTLGITDPVKIVKALYYWIEENIPWASALEYSIFECIPDYVLKYRHGDCGMVSFLFMSMARYKGIPVKWQSGWMLHPGYENLHDWVEVYYEGIGWIPLDVSFGLISSTDSKIRDYYITGIDAFRLIVNDAVAAELNPPKQFYRSEPFDFQRGELEWSGGNLYFNQWDYSLKIINNHEQ
ncbi:MAG: transglutaminase-like domain-containing protein [Bacteroidota bacterium]|nr:transglutaminase-like domain-containing protein [Bacteroidota bacterium]